MSKFFATLIDEIEQELQDNSNATWDATELAIQLEDAIREVSDYKSHVMMHSFKLESRTGSATTDMDDTLVDSSAQFIIANDIGKVIYNTDDKTWAVVIADGSNSTTQLKLSKDIMEDGDEAYKMFNKGCWNNKQINIEDVTDYLGEDHGVLQDTEHSPEYPIGEKRNVDVTGDILTIDIDFNPPDSSASDADVEVFVWFETRQRVSQLADLAGTVNGTPVAGATTFTIAAVGSGSDVIAEDTLFTVAGVRGTYKIKYDLTLSSGGGVIIFWPGLESAPANGAVVAFIGSTLSRSLERLVVKLTAARASISKGMVPISQVNSAITLLTTINSTVDTMSARITQSINDISSGRTEVDKTPAIVASAATAIGKIDDEVSQAISDLDSGRTEVEKVATVISSAAIALGKVDVEVAKAIVDLASARTEVDKTPTIVDSAATAIGKVNNQIGQAITDLHAGRSLINEINKGGAGVPSDNANYARTDLANANGYLSEAQGYFNQATKDESIASSYSRLAQTGLANASAYIGQARGYLNQATADESLTRTYTTQAQGVLATARGYLTEAQGYFGQATQEESIASSYSGMGARELSAATSYLNQAGGYIRELTSRLNVASSFRLYQEWGERRLAFVLNELETLQSQEEPATQRTWPKDK